MTQPRGDLYDVLLAEARSSQKVKRVVLGLSWSFAEVDGYGLCWSPRDVPRTHRWPGTLRGRPATELTRWIRSTDASEAAVGACVLNAVVNEAFSGFAAQGLALPASEAPHLAVFSHFRARVAGARVVVVGRYPGLEHLWDPSSYVCVERSPLPGTVLESEAAPWLARADWVFVTASSIANHTLPTLLASCPQAEVVLMGPSLPWLPHWADLGVDHLAGVVVTHPRALVDVVSEGGGTRLFDEAVGYRLMSFR
jgi:uncharacterized protein (DUF4213/DUF364 family)